MITDYSKLVVSTLTYRLIKGVTEAAVAEIWYLAVVTFASCGGSVKLKSLGHCFDFDRMKVVTSSLSVGFGLNLECCSMNFEVIH